MFRYLVLFGWDLSNETLIFKLVVGRREGIGICVRMIILVC